MRTAIVLAATFVAFCALLFWCSGLPLKRGFELAYVVGCAGMISALIVWIGYENGRIK